MVENHDLYEHVNNTNQLVKPVIKIIHIGVKMRDPKVTFLK